MSTIPNTPSTPPPTDAEEKAGDDTASDSHDGILQTVQDVFNSATDIPSATGTDDPAINAELAKLQEVFGKAYEPYITNDEFQVLNVLSRDERPDNPPPGVNAWECRIGLSKFIVPPLNINVSQTFRAGAISSALRANSSPKFNSGHSETMISMTLYFPTHESIWGYNGDRITVDFDKDDDSVIDTLASSVRGLITQFKYAPFVPVKNQYLNQTYNIHGVTMHSMTVSTVKDFPFCLVVQLNLLKFNHKVYMPMITNFDQAIHWGRFRQYFGRAIQAMAAVATKGFLTSKDPSDYQALLDQQNEDTLLARYRDLLPEYWKKTGSKVEFDKIKEWEDGRAFNIYYPEQTPIHIAYPDLTSFRDPNVNANERKSRNWWQTLISDLGFPIAADSEASYETAARYSSGAYGTNLLRDEKRLLSEFLRATSTAVTDMNADLLETYTADRLADYNRTHPDGSINSTSEFRSAVRASWFATVYESFIQDPYLANVFENQEQSRGFLLLKEWEVPMRRLDLDPDNVIVSGVSVSLGNNFSRLQLQMQDEPVHQHLGSLDTRADIQLTIMGEEDLAKLRILWDHINGLSRLEHGHGVLGFIGVKNVLTALCGMKYAMPESFEVDSVPNFPHIYNVRLSFIDFDVFQQKREILSSEQQADLIEAFSKRNPFLRIKQRWAAFSAYPDLPLAVRDEDGKIMGHFDPDYYFHAFKTIDDDVVDTDNGFQSPVEVMLMQASKTVADAVQTNPIGALEKIQVLADGIRTAKNGSPSDVAAWWEANADQVKINAQIPGLTPLGNYQNPYKDKAGNPKTAFDHILKDAQFRDKGGRMIRAFPTYMLWLIDEGGTFTGVKLYDNFYGLQSVLDIAVGQSEDCMSDTLVLQVSNLYSRLSTPYRNLIDESLYSTAHIINTQINRTRNLASGLTDYLVTLDTVELKPGVRVHLRMGYSANPNALDTVFNGVITNVQQGEIITITAQSDTVELSAVINNSDPEANSGKLDGSFFGMWISEPRDLMVRLLTIGASTMKQNLAYATKGRVFSENRWGIRHFGSMLYPTMTDAEKSAHDLSSAVIDGGVKALMGGGITDILGGPAGLFNFGLFDVFTSATINYAKKRDYEVFKRNIYPGNGLGVTQYMGGDLGDAGISLGLSGSTGVDVDGQIIDPATGKPTVPRTAAEIVGAGPATSTPTTSNYGSGSVDSGWGDLVKNAGLSLAFPAVALKNVAHPILQAFGLSQDNTDDDVSGADEVSFRANTYMKSVWDMFQMCAALLPNYIVAIRPFEERSTVFYGKPHWLYTSGVIPLTKGVEPEKLGYEEPDADFLDILQKARQGLQAEKETDREFYDRISSTTTSNPTASTAGMIWDGRDISALPLTAKGKGEGSRDAVIPIRQTGVGMEMHLPTHDNAPSKTDGHLQIALPEDFAYPYYMDRVGGGAGGYGGFSLKDQNQADPGQHGAFGVLNPEDEEFYCAMPWPYHSSTLSGVVADGNSYFADGRGKRLMVYNTVTQKGCICAVGEWGPADFVINSQGIAAGISPDAAFSIDLTRGDQCLFGWVDDNAPLGPVIFKDGVSGATGSGTTGGSSTTNSGLPAAPQNNTGKVDSTGRPPSTQQSDFLDPLPDDVAIQVAALIKKQDTTGSVKTLSQAAYLYGWQIGNFPVDYSDPATGRIDERGLKAKEVYSSEHSESEAQTVWNEFRMDFKDEAGTREVFDRVFPGRTDDQYDAVVSEFEKYMWQNAYNRGWLVRTVDASLTLGGAISGDGNYLGQVLTNIPLPATAITGTILDDTTGAIGQVIDTGYNLLDDPVGTVGDFFGGGGSGNHYDFDNARKVFEVWLGDPSQADQFMIENTTPGKDQRGILGRGVEEAYTKIWQPMWDTLKSIWDAVGSALTGVLSLFRFSLMSLGQGVSQATYQQSISNLMNKAFNDSIYYNAGPPGTLAYLADNPFTREYGEPVVEVRQPFQRVHMINSFRNIISNGIEENIDGVPTVVTATTSGKKPVTVYLDKGLPSEKQVEKAVETGLIWDQPDGFFDHIFHPIKSFEEFASGFNNGDVETSAKRVALWHLKEGLKNIYGGELVVLGDANIRPHDLIYLGDVYERMYGLCEVEQVVHHMNAEMGFVTSITPNALVTINDPARWNMMSYLRARLNTWNLRNDLRHVYLSRGLPGQSGLPDYLNQYDIANSFSGQIMGATEYTGGNTALVKDLTGASMTGQLGAGQYGPSSGSLPSAMFGGMSDWSPWNWVKEKLLDQHGCYIQYLTKDGRPMDANLADNRGVAVGQQRISTLFKNSLHIQLPFQDENGNSRIATQDLLQAIGWQSSQLTDLVQDLDLESNLVKSQVLDLAGRNDGPTPGSDVQVLWVRISKVVDGDTFYLKVLGSSDGGQALPEALAATSVRVAGVDAPEVAHKGLSGPEGDNEADLRAAEALQPGDPGVVAWRYTFDRLAGKEVALRISKQQPLDIYQRLLGWIFEYTPDSVPADKRKETLIKLAGGYPLVSWDDYWDDGTPYTFNWEMVVTGHANVYLFDYDKNLPNQGVDGPFPGVQPGG